MCKVVNWVRSKERKRVRIVTRGAKRGGASFPHPFVLKWGCGAKVCVEGCLSVHPPFTCI